jgi:hypothetical protein
VTEQRWCHACGAALVSGARFCGACGTPVTDPDAPTATAAPPGLSPPPPRETFNGTDGYAIASLVLAIAAFGLGSILAVIFGHLSLGRIRRSGGTLGGHGLAVAGLVLGYAGLAVSVAGLLAFASAWGDAGAGIGP